jgi:SAM-dependent methyltransferase
MLSDPWFEKNVTRILCEEELMLPAAWFAGKEVLDCGCGGGRWCYGFAKLGAHVTAVDVNTSAIQATEKALEPFSVRKTFIQSPLESLSDNLPADRQFDVVFSWGVLHHCRSFTGSLQQICRYVKEGGLLHLFLYGQEEQGFQHELGLFKQRVYYNSLPTWEERERFLVQKAGADPDKMNKKHDLLAPLVNRRLEFPYVRDLLLGLGFSNVELTKKQMPSYAEAEQTGCTRNLFIRAIKGNANGLQSVLLPNPEPPYWFWRYRRPELVTRYEEPNAV